MQLEAADWVSLLPLTKALQRAAARSSSAKTEISSQSPGQLLTSNDVLVSSSPSQQNLRLAKSALPESGVHLRDGAIAKALQRADRVQGHVLGGAKGEAADCACNMSAVAIAVLSLGAAREGCVHLAGSAAWCAI